MTDADTPSNGPTEGQIQQAFNQIIGHHQELASEKGAYMQRCRQIRETMAGVYTWAADIGITKKVLRTKVKTHLLENRIDALIDSLEDDHRSEYERVGEALGDYADTPLGGAAMSRARAHDGQQVMDGLTSQQ